MSSEEKHKERIEERRSRIEKMIVERRKRILESEEKKKLTKIEKESLEKDRRITILEEKVLALEKVINQIKLDFSRYRARNK